MWTNKRWALIILSLILASGLAACGKEGTATPQAQEESGKLRVYTSFYPLYYLAKRIGGEHAEVINMVPPGVEPHDYEPTTKELVAWSKADLFLYNGSGFELWIDKALESLNNDAMVVVNASEGLDLLRVEEREEHAEGHQEDEGHEESGEHHEEAHEESSGHEGEHAEAHGEEHHHGEFDPHIWLDPQLYKEQAKKVKEAFVKIDSAHQSDYEQNWQALEAELDQLHGEFQAMVKNAGRKDFMVSHSAFGYLARAYGLKQIAISGLSPSDEPSPSELKELIEHVREHNISYILLEPLASPKVAEVISRETGARTGVLNPLEGLTEEEAKAGKDYFSIMRENLNMLKMALAR